MYLVSTLPNWSNTKEPDKWAHQSRIQYLRGLILYRWPQSPRWPLSFLRVLDNTHRQVAGNGVVIVALIRSPRCWLSTNRTKFLCLFLGKEETENQSWSRFSIERYVLSLYSVTKGPFINSVSRDGPFFRSRFTEGNSHGHRNNSSVA